MTIHVLGNALIAYEDSLLPFSQEQQTIEAWHVLTVLNARDRLHIALEKSPDPGARLLTDIHALDQQLQNQAVIMVAKLDFNTYRKSFAKPFEQWWWFLDEALETSELNAYDWTFRGLTTLAWAISIGLLVDISSRFLLGGAGVAGLSAVALSNLLTLLKARSDLTDAGNEGVQFFFKQLKVQKTWHLRAKFGSTALLTGLLFSFWLALPTISNNYNRRGQTTQVEGKLGSAEKNYNRAISLNPDNVSAHYNLGTLYEDIQELQQAESQYSIAVRGDLPEAYNNLARLYLQSTEPNLNKAVALLYQGLKLADKQKSYLEIKYSLYKNLGWALFQEGQHESAQSALETAIALSNQPEAYSPDGQSYVKNLGSAHCLLAQNLEATGKPNTLPSWQRCCQLGDRGDPDENAWLTLARQRLETKKLDYNKVCRPTASPLS